MRPITLLPSSSFTVSAAVLSDGLLNNQLVDCLKLFRALTGQERIEWMTDQGVMMWYGCEYALYLYATICDRDWQIRRGGGHMSHEAWYRFDIEYHKWFNARRLDPDYSSSWFAFPDWLGSDAIHKSHQAYLKHCDPKRYEHKWPNVLANPNICYGANV